LQGKICGGGKLSHGSFRPRPRMVFENSLTIVQKCDNKNGEL